MSATAPPQIETIFGRNALTEARARDFNFAERVRDGEVRAEIPAAYQGDDFKHAKELSKGMEVIDSHYGSPRLCVVTKTFTYSVQLQYQGRKYSAPIHHLRRVK